MAKGSQTTLGGWEPRLCAGCGKPVTVTSGDVFYTHAGVGGAGPQAYHHGCHSEAVRRGMRAK